MVVFHNRGVLHSVVGAFTVRPRPLILIPRPFFLNPADRFCLLSSGSPGGPSPSLPPVQPRWIIRCVAVSLTSLSRPFPFILASRGLTLSSLAHALADPIGPDAEDVKKWTSAAA